MKKNKQKIAIILGTRPEIIKMSPIIRECAKRSDVDFFIIHSNQHYSEKLDAIFFRDLLLPRPKYNLNIGSGTHGDVTGRMIIEMEKILVNEAPTRVIVQGDTNTVLAGGISAVKLNIPVVHVEAGLRSFDNTMPEEVNRIIVDHLSTYLFPPTLTARGNLSNEGLTKGVFVAGNTIVDALKESLNIAKKNSNILNELDLTPKKYILVTAHRQENVDNKKRLSNIFFALSNVANFSGMRVILPAHPRLVKMLKNFNIKVSNKIEIIEPLGYLDFLKLENNAKIIITDSGGLQEESCIMGVPCVTIRDNTERPETVDAGSNILAGADKVKIERAVKCFIKNKKKWNNPFGKIGSAKRIISHILK